MDDLNQALKLSIKVQLSMILGGFTPSYILHTCVFGTYLLGGYLPCIKDYKVMVFYM
jgi:hypothetical protein